MHHAPRQDNVLFLPFASEMTPQQQQGNLSWAMFPGGWVGRDGASRGGEAPRDR